MIGETTMLEMVYARCASTGIPTFLAIPTKAEEENDVLSRYYRVARDNSLDIIIRVTSDCPLIPPYEILRCLEEFKSQDCDYLTNRPAVIDGWDVEVMSYHALSKAYYEAKDSYDREHVTPYIKKDRSIKQGILDDPKLSVDTESDLQEVRRYYELERKILIDNGRYGFVCDELHKTHFVAGHNPKDYPNLQPG